MIPREAYAKYGQQSSSRESATGNGDTFDMEGYLSMCGFEVSRRKPWHSFVGGEVFELVQCPFDASHTQGSAAFTVVEGVPGFACKHNGCHGKTIKDVFHRYPPEKKTRPGPSKPQSKPAAETPLVVLAVEELLAREIKTREMLLDPILPKQGLAMLYAYRGIGKTHLALGIGAAVASGAAFLSWKAPKPCRVLYVDGELPAATLREWFAMTLAGIEESEPGPDMLRIVTPDLQDRPMPDLATLEGQRLLEPHLDGVELLIIDNLSALCRYGVENEGESWVPVQEWALSLRRRGISVLFIHHAGKNLSQRGSSRREDLLDTVITLRHPKDYSPNEGLRCEVHFEKTRAMLGDLAKPFEVRLETGSDRRAVWTWRELEDAKARRAAVLYAQGMSVRDVADELGISRSAAQRLRARWATGESGGVSQRPTV